MSSAGTVPRAAVPVSDARADASRRNGAKSLDPKTEPTLGAQLTEAYRSPLPACGSRKGGPQLRSPAACAGSRPGAATDSHHKSGRLLKH